MGNSVSISTRTNQHQNPPNFKMKQFLSLLALVSVAFAQNYDGCGVEKGCLGHPRGCEATQDCQGLATFKRNALDLEAFDYELWTSYSTSDAWWIAVAWSEDQNMGNDFAVICTNDGGSATSNAWLTAFPKGVEVMDSDGISADEVSASAAEMSCSFTKLAETIFNIPGTGELTEVDILAAPSFFMMATGPMRNGKPDRHVHDVYSELPIDFNDY